MKLENTHVNIGDRLAGELPGVEVIAAPAVLVVGGGPAGVAAAVAAAEMGADCLLVEASGRLGGMMTSGNAGLTNAIFHHKHQGAQREIVAMLAEEPERVQIVGGLPKRIMDRALEAGIAVGTHGTEASYVFTSPVEFNWLLMDLCEETGVEVLFHAFCVDSLVCGNAIRGVIIESKEGRKAIAADLVIDATGDGDVAARAGAPFVLGIGPEDKAYQAAPEHAGKMGAMGVMYRIGNVDIDRALAWMAENDGHFYAQGLAKYTLREAREFFDRGEMVTFMAKGETYSLQVYNSPHAGVVTLCCPCYPGNGLKLADLTRAEFAMRDRIREQLEDIRKIPGFDRCVVLDVPEIGVRETRHIRGEYLLTVDDMLERRKFPDSIGRGSHTIDTDHVPREIRDREIGDDWAFQIPYRCLVPLRVENLLVAGRCASFSHEAFGATRTTVQCMIMGEAAGVAAALCARTGKTPRTLPPDSLTAELTRRGASLN
jgi:hypothetical protein